MSASNPPKLPDPMAEDELDQILLDLQKNTDVWWNTPRPEYKGKNPGIMLKEAKAAINTYTTNKIRDALENLPISYFEGDNDLWLKYISIKDRDEAVKALNHRKDD